MQNFFVSFAGSLLATIIILLWQRKDFLELELKWGSKLLVVIPVFLITGISLYSLWGWIISLDNIDDTIKIIIIISGFISLLLLWVVLFAVLKNFHTLKQHTKPFTVMCKESNRTISIRSLIGEGVTDDEPITLYWHTIKDGLNYLCKQIKAYKPQIRPELCVGINNAGTLMAAYLSSAIWAGEKIVGYIRTGTEGTSDKKKRIILYQSLPEIENTKTIIVADGEVKSGTSRKLIDTRLQEVYGSNVDILHVIMVACKVKKNFSNIRDLRKRDIGLFVEDERYLPDFLAFTSKGIVEWSGGLK